MIVQSRIDNKQSDTLVKLYHSHLIFQNYLDKLAVIHDDLTTLDLILAVRKVNITSLTRCSDLISRKHIELNPSQHIINGIETRFAQDDMTLWNLHGQLTRLLPVYAQAIRVKSLDKMTKMMIGLNYEELISVKENLLHPLPALEIV